MTVSCGELLQPCSSIPEVKNVSDVRTVTWLTRMLHMAEACGVSQFYTGFVCSAAGMNRKKELQKLLGIEGCTIHAGIALGMPSFHFDKYIDKKDVVLKRID